MAYIPARPIIADDPLAYFSSLIPPQTQTTRPALVHPADRALDLMYGYYSAD